MNNNVSKFTSSAGGVSMTEKFDYGKDNLASKYTYPSGKTASCSCNFMRSCICCKKLSLLNEIGC